jgi:hypothetical protein
LYATNEENMLDWKGNMITKKDRVQVILSEVAKDTALAASVQISSVENCAIDTVLQRSHSASEEKILPCWKHIPGAADELSSVLAAVSPILNDETLYEMLQNRADLGRFQMSMALQMRLQTCILHPHPIPKVTATPAQSVMVRLLTAYSLKLHEAKSTLMKSC